MTDLNGRTAVALAVKAPRDAALTPTAAAGPDAFPPASVRPLPPAQAELVTMVELLFFAYRDFTAEPDAILAEIGFGRAHHRVLHFVNRHPGLRVADLLDVLRITKQSLARVLKQLVDEGYIVQAAGANDRRERRLHLSETGRALAEQLLAIQTRRIADALMVAGGDAKRIAQSFLLAVIGDSERCDVQRIVDGLRESEPATLPSTFRPATSRKARCP